MMTRKLIAHPVLAEGAGDVVTSIAIGSALRRALDRRRTEQVAKRRLVRRPAATL